MKMEKHFVQHIIYINSQILFLTVYIVCIYLSASAILLFHYPIPKNQQMNAKYNVAVGENRCNILYHRNIIQCCIICFIHGYSNRSRFCLQACLWSGWAGGAKRCWLEEGQDRVHHSQCPTAQPGWATWAVLSCRACAQHSSQDGALLLKPLGHRTDLWWEMGPWAALPQYHLCALPLSDSTAPSFHVTIIPDYS